MKKYVVFLSVLVIISCVKTIPMKPDDNGTIFVHCILKSDSLQTLKLQYLNNIQYGDSYIDDGFAYLLKHSSILSDKGDTLHGETDTIQFINKGNGEWIVNHTPTFGAKYELIYSNPDLNIWLRAETTFPNPHNVYPIRSFEELIFFNFIVDSNPDIGYAIDTTDGEKLKHFREEGRYWFDTYNVTWLETFGDEFDYFFCDVAKRFNSIDEWYMYHRELVLRDDLLYPNIDPIYFTKLFSRKKYHMDLNTHRIFNPIYYNITPNDNYIVWIYGMDYVESSDGVRWELASKIVTDHKLCDNFNTTPTKFKNILNQVNHYDTTLSQKFGTYNHLETLVHDRYLRIENHAGYNNGYLDHIRSIIDDPGMKFKNKYYDFYNDIYEKYDRPLLFPKESYFDSEYSHLFSSLFIVDGNFKTPYMYNCFKMLPDSSDVLYGGNGNTTHSYSQNSKYFLGLDANPARLQEGRFPHEPFMGIDEQYRPYQGYLCFLFVSPEYDRYMKETYKKAARPLTDYTDVFNNKNLYTNIEGGTGIFGACYEVRKNAY